MGEAAADRATVADLRMARVLEALAEPAVGLRIALHRGGAREGAEPPGLHGVEPRQPVDVDDECRAGDPEVQHRHEALAAREDGRLVAALGQQRERLLQRRRRLILERRGLQAKCLGPGSRTSCIVVQRTPPP